MRSLNETSEAGRTPSSSSEKQSGVFEGFGWASLPVTLRYAILIAILLGIWQLYVSVSGVSPLILPGPVEVAAAFFEAWASGAILAPTLFTLKVLALAMLVGIVVSAMLTVLATWTRVGDDLLTLLTSMLNPLPAIAILPLTILWFGINPTAIGFVVVYSVTWPLAINLSMGFKTVNPTIMMVGRNLGLGGWRMIRDVLMPAALPHIISGLRTGWAFGWRTVVAAELVFGVAGEGGGLGWFINEARIFTRVPDVFAGLITIALLGILVEAVFTFVERRTVIRWGMKSGA